MQAGLFKRISLLAMLMGMVSGCSISPTVDAASWTLDGVSYLLTGKATMDHAVSAMARQDCKMIRMVKKEIVCLPRDEDVVGDRLVFTYEKSSWTGTSEGRTDSGDPLHVNPALGDIMQPLGSVVWVEGRSTAIAAVAADPVPIRAMVGAGGETESWTAMISGFVKNKPTISAGTPDLSTRLWLPVR